MTNQEALWCCKRLVRNAGFHASAGSWCDETRAYVFSVESPGAAVLGHSTYAVESRLGSGGVWEFFRNNEAISRDELARLLRYKRAWYFWFGGRMAEQYTPKKESTDV
jgi:hypothetical protein